MEGTKRVEETTITIWQSPMCNSLIQKRSAERNHDIVDKQIAVHAAERNQQVPMPDHLLHR